MCIFCGTGSAVVDALLPLFAALAIVLPFELASRLKDWVGGKKACPAAKK
jgi:hypothetical protein